MVWMLFDKEMKLVKTGQSSGARQIPEGAGQVKQMAENDIVMDQGGFLTAYTVNESPSSVYIDNFQLMVQQGTLLEENHYYPFGMLNTQLSHGSSDPINNYKYNDKELQTDLSLQWLDYGARFYDPVIGRWNSIDPLAEKNRRWSFYTYGLDNPIRFIDPDGMEAGIPPGGFWGSFLKNIDVNWNNVASSINQRIDHPGILLNDIASTANGVMQTLSDVTLASNIVGNENKTANTVGNTLNTIASLPNATPEQQGKFAADLTKVVAGAVLLNKVGGLISDFSKTISAGVESSEPSAITTKGAPKPTPNFKTPTNAAQLPPADVPKGFNLRVMGQTQQYPNGYWVLENPQANGGWQKVNPTTMKPGQQHETHVPLPEGYWNN